MQSQFLEILVLLMEELVVEVAQAISLHEQTLQNWQTSQCLYLQV